MVGTWLIVAPISIAYTHCLSLIGVHQSSVRPLLILLHSTGHQFPTPLTETLGCQPSAVQSRIAITEPRTLKWSLQQLC